MPLTQEPGADERNSLLTPNEVAAFLKLSLSWLAKSRVRGDGPPFVKIGHAVRYQKDAILIWLIAHTKGRRKTKRKAD